jgi:hypothetical protein
MVSFLKETVPALYLGPGEALALGEGATKYLRPGCPSSDILRLTVLLTVCYEVGTL